MKIKTAWFVLIGALAITIPVRVYQMLFLVDPTTEFFTDHNISAICLAAFMLVVLAVMMFLCFEDKNAPKRFGAINSIPATLAAGAAGVGVIVHAIYALLVDNRAQNSHSAGVSSAVQGGQTYLNVIMAFVGVAAGVVLLIQAISFALGKNLFTKIPAAAIIPPLWFCINLITLFTNYVNVTYMTENMMDMFSLIFATLFLLYQGKMLANFSTVKAGKRIYAYGLPTILFGFVSALPSFVLQALNYPHTSSLKLTLNIVLFLVAVYALVFLLIYPKIPNHQKAPEPQLPTEPEPPVAPPLEENRQEAAPTEEEPPIFENDGREIPYLFHREPTLRIEKKEKKKKKKKRSIFYFIPFVKKRVDKKEAEAQRPAWTPAKREEAPAKRLENDWLLDMYGYERRPKNGAGKANDEPYIPKVIDAQPETPQAGTTDSQP